MSKSILEMIQSSVERGVDKKEAPKKTKGKPTKCSKK